MIRGLRLALWEPIDRQKEVRKELAGKTEDLEKIHGCQVTEEHLTCTVQLVS